MKCLYFVSLNVFIISLFFIEMTHCANRNSFDKNFTATTLSPSASSRTSFQFFKGNAAPKFEMGACRTKTPDPKEIELRTEIAKVLRSLDKKICDEIKEASSGRISPRQLDPDFPAPTVGFVREIHRIERVEDTSSEPDTSSNSSESDDSLVLSTGVRWRESGFVALYSSFPVHHPRVRSYSPRPDNEKNHEKRCKSE